MQLEQACTRVQNDVAALQKQAQAARGHRAGLQKQEQRAGQALQSKREALRQVAAARRKLLQDLENSFDHYSRSVKAVMNEHAKGALRAATLYGTVASLVQVPKAYALAIEVALGGAAQNIVTQSEDDAKAAIAFLKRSKQGRATFLPLSAARGGLLNEQGAAQCAGFLGIASPLVSVRCKIPGGCAGLAGQNRRGGYN